MKKLNKWIFASLAALFLVAGAIMVRHQLKPRDIPVLMYHNVLENPGNDIWFVSTSDFENHLSWLRRQGYTSVSLDDVWYASKGLGWLPEKPVVITFDDGYRGVIDNAEPLLEKYGFQATLFVPVSWIVNGVREYRGVPIVSKEELVAMNKRGTIKVGVHALGHESSIRKQKINFKNARLLLKKSTQINATSYCYPNGSTNEELQYLIKTHRRYRTATACKDRMFHYEPDANFFEIPRVSIYGGTREFSATIDSSQLADGIVSALIRRTGNEMPFVVVLRDTISGLEWQYPECFREIPKSGLNVTFANIPLAVTTNSLSIEIWEQNRLYREL